MIAMHSAILAVFCLFTPLLSATKNRVANSGPLEYRNHAIESGAKGGYTYLTQAPAQVPWTGTLPTCDTTLPDDLLGECLENIAESMKQSCSVGIPELGIPPMDPFTSDQITLKPKSRVISFDASFTNISITGFRNFTNLRYGFNTTGGNARYSVTFPRIRIGGFYDAGGTVILKVLPVPISGQGQFWFKFYNLRLFGSSGLRQGVVGGETVLQVYDVVTDITIADYKFNLQNFGGEVLGPIINGLANSYRGLILRSIKPALKAKSDEIIFVVLNSFLPSQPYLAKMLNRQTNVSLITSILDLF